MATSKIVLREVEEFMAGYVPPYTPVYTALLSRGIQHSTEVGKLDFRRVETIGSIRAEHVTPKDSELKVVSVTERHRYFRKYFLANQFTISNFQDRLGVEDVIAQVLDEHQAQADELVMFGEGTSNANVINAGIYYSNDPYFSLLQSVEISNTNQLYDLHNKIMATAIRANEVAGQKVLLLYGQLLLPLANGVYSTAVRAFKAALQEVLGPDYTILEVPAYVTPADSNGWIIVNVDQVRLHYTALPRLFSQGFNDEKMYYWFNFLMGSMMVEVMAKDGIIRQPCTFEAV